VDVYFSTVVRWAPLEQGGELVHLDWDAQRVVARRPVVPTDPDVDDINPRGGARGGRGVALVDDDVVVASYHTLLVHGLHDPDLAPARRVTHPLLAGLHELHDCGDGTLWVAATAIDAALRVDLRSGEVVDQRWPRDDPQVQRALGIEPLAVDRTADNRQQWLLRAERSDVGHLHLNAVALRRGRLIGLCNHPGVVLDLDDDRVILRHDELRGAHNLVVLDDDTVLTSGTTKGSVNRWDLDAGAIVSRIDLGSFAWVRRHVGRHRVAFRLARLAEKARLPGPRAAHPLFVRGMARHGNELFVGISPAAILRIDWRTGAFVDAFAYSDDVRVCVHGLAVAS
jgi:hypothetical protein